MKKNICILAFLFAFIDQIIKVFISKLIPLNTDITIVPNFFYLANAHNDGAAFSAFQGNHLFLIVMTIISFIIVYLFFIKGKDLKRNELFLVSMLLGGILGNFIDRIIYGYVIDYLEFIFGNYHFPIFNFADSCIVISVLCLLFISFKEDLCKNTKSKSRPVE